jgi:hypothetical protein
MARRRQQINRMTRIVSLYNRLSSRIDRRRLFNLRLLDSADFDSLYVCNYEYW